MKEFVKEMSFKSGVKGRGSDRWWEQRWWLWWGDMHRWTRRRVNRMRLMEWRELIPRVRWCISKRAHMAELVCRPVDRTPHRWGNMSLLAVTWLVFNQWQFSISDDGTQYYTVRSGKISTFAHSKWYVKQQWWRHQKLISAVRLQHKQKWSKF